MQTQNLLQIKLLKMGEIVQILDKFIQKDPICCMTNMDYGKEKLWWRKPIFSLHEQNYKSW